MAIVLENSVAHVTPGGAWGFSATAGRLLVCSAGVREYNVTYAAPSGWTALAKRSPNTVPSMNAFLFGKIAAGGETAFGGSPSGGNANVNVAEFSGVNLTGPFDGGGTNGSTGTPVGAAVTPTNGAECIVCATLCSHGGALAGGAGWSSIGGASPPVGESDWPFMAFVYKIIPVASGSYTPTANGDAGNEWAGATEILYSGVIAIGSSRAIIAGV